jgi:hypothetical protein
MSLAFTLIDLNGKERKGQIILDDDARSGKWTLDGDDAEARVDRLDTGMPEAAWFQEVPTGAFEGYWVHASQKMNNTILEKVQPGRFVGLNQGGARRKVLTVAAGNLIFAIQSPNYTESRIFQGVLSLDGQKLTLDPPKPGPRVPRQNAGIELSKKSSD